MNIEKISAGGDLRRHHIIRGCIRYGKKTNKIKISDIFCSLK